ncbi:FAD-binding oxidoreductase, partial [Rhodopseudomonas sp. B29]|uniref:NAD(P)/FAD-dependent oxidoreductase n=1 Tax=Rhodopseudomonas sp. B29 TaxID=95607 RepID=UPI0003B71965
MTLRDADIVVLGAGVVGVSAALHLQRRGRDVVLVDRNDAAGEGTSYGNAGLIECASVFPYMFPRDLGHLLRYAVNASADAHYQLSGIPEFLPWLVRYFFASSKAGAARSAQAALPLIRQSLTEHEILIGEAGVPELLRKTGWIKLFRSQPAFASALAELERARALGVTADVLDPAMIATREPDIAGDFAGAIHWLEPGFIPDPGGLVKAYAALFARNGGRFARGDARSLEQHGGGWRVTTADGAVSAREVVVALGPWSDSVFKPLGYRIPLGVKRGYHQHFAPRTGAALN